MPPKKLTVLPLFLISLTATGFGWPMEREENNGLQKPIASEQQPSHENSGGATTAASVTSRGDSSSLALKEPSALTDASRDRNNNMETTRFSPINSGTTASSTLEVKSELDSGMSPTTGQMGAHSVRVAEFEMGDFRDVLDSKNVASATGTAIKGISGYKYIKSLLWPQVKDFQSYNKNNPPSGSGPLGFLQNYFSSQSPESDPASLVQKEPAVETASQAFLAGNKGIQNSGVDCYLNSALQCLKTVFSQCSEEQVVDTVTAFEGNPHLLYFLTGNTDTSKPENATKLRLEIAHLLHNETGLEESDRNNIDKNGASQSQADPIDYLRVLLPRFGKSTMRKQVDHRSCIVSGLPKNEAVKLADLIGIDDRRVRSNSPNITRTGITLNNERSGNSAAEPTIVDMQLSQAIIHSEVFPTFDCDLEEGQRDTDIQSLVRSKTVETKRVFFNEVLEHKLYKERFGPMQAQGEAIPESSDFYQDVLTEEKIIAPPPLSLVITIKRLHATYGFDENDNFVQRQRKIMTPVDHIWDPVVLAADQEGREFNVTYAPTSIICHLGNEQGRGGHYISYRRNGNDWFEFNDDKVEQVNLDDFKYGNYSYKDIIRQNACVISYELMHEVSSQAAASNEETSSSSSNF